MAFTTLGGFLRKVASGGQGVGALVVTADSADPLVVDRAVGTYAYSAGTATGTVDVPSGAKLRSVSVVAGSSASATVTIGGGNTITIPAGFSLDLDSFGATTNLDVVIGGTIQSYYVAWTT